MLKVKAGKLVETIWPLVKADIPVFIHGPTGIGKSYMMREQLLPMATREWGDTVLHDFRLSTKDTVDGTGLPDIDKEKRATYWTRPAFIPEDDGRMHIILLDEISHASVQMQHAVGYQLTLDRALGEFKLPKKNRIILCLNTREDRGGDNKIVVPFANRGAHVLVEKDLGGWVDWAVTKGIDPRLIAFQKLRPELLHQMSDESPAWPSPRTVEMVSRLMNESSTALSNGAEALCGKAYAMQLMSFLKDLGAALPKLSEIKRDPEGARVPPDLHHQYIIALAISDQIKAADAGVWARYLKRLEADIHSMAANKAINRVPELKDDKALKALVLDE